VCPSPASELNETVEETSAMAIVERETELPELAPAEAAEPARSMGIFERPTATHGWKSWVTTTDHKKIGIMYGAAALFFFLVGGAEALIVRAQLATPDSELISADFYNQLFTMHGVTMVFFVIIPLGAAFANYILPLQIGARDVAFPRLNAFGFWAFLSGSIFANISWFTGGGSDCGWFCYTPNSSLSFSPGHGVDYFLLGVQIAGIASLVGAINLIVTVLNLRAPGMTLMRMPAFTWMILVVQFLLLFALPVIAIALILLTFDRNFGANFFNVAAGADPLLWQHLFWVFGHPEVYILVLPAFGIVSDTLPVFSRKPLFGYAFVVFSGIAIGFMGWGVWAHHMFVSGIGPVAVAAFSLTTMFIAVPTGVKILNWMATMWGGSLRFTTAMMFSISLVAMFTIGGLSGVMHSVSPSDTQQTDTYFIVAHFHYVLFGGAAQGFFAGAYYWWPKMFGRMLNERIGKLNFWLIFLGFNLTFFPMHVTGLMGQPRRTWQYDNALGVEWMNLLSTIGAFTIGCGALVFVYNIWRSRKGPQAPPDPWDGRTLEWSIPSPPPEHNFDYQPIVESLDDWWHKKYRETEDGQLVKEHDGNEIAQKGTRTDVHLPSPSYWPLVLALALPIMAFGVIYNRWLIPVGAVIAIGAIYAWFIEPPYDPAAAHGHGEDGHEDHPVAVGGPDGAHGADVAEEATVD
jgi:cytochrome c oxidase subunit I